MGMTRARNLSEACVPVAFRAIRAFCIGCLGACFRLEGGPNVAFLAARACCVFITCAILFFKLRTSAKAAGLGANAES